MKLSKKKMDHIYNMAWEELQKTNRLEQLPRNTSEKITAYIEMVDLLLTDSDSKEQLKIELFGIKEIVRIKYLS